MSTLVRILILATGLCYAACVCAAEQDRNGLKDLYFGEALYYADQADYFSAISRLDTELAQYYGLDEPEKNSFHFYQDNAEFDVGDFELYYRMYGRAGRAIKAVIEGNVPERTRNGAIYRLAKIYYETQQPLEALSTIKKLKGEVPEKIRYEEPFLRAQIDIETGRFSEAIRLLRKIENAPGMVGFAGYNLGVALIRSGKERQGIAELDKVGQLASDDRAVQAIRDKANLVLGFRLLENKQSTLAKKYLDRVRISGPFSNKALLGAGWAAAASGKYDRALVPWSILSKRNVTNRAVQEAMLGLPYAYSKLGVYGKAALLYGHALQSFSQEISRLDASIKSIREGRFLAALIREEIKKDKYWVVHLRKLPKTPETYYLLDLLASNDFQSSLKNYFDLAELHRKLQHWETYVAAYKQMVQIRAAYYEPLLPTIEAKFRKLDSKMKLRVEQRDRLDNRLKKMLITPRPEFLETADERRTLLQLDRMEKSLPPGGNAKIRARIARLRGVIMWHVKTEYQDRFSKATKHLHELDADVKRLRRIYHSFVRTRQAATQSYQGYDSQLTHLRIKMQQADDTIKQLMARQGHMIEVMAINELERRRKRLEQYQVKARFAMAESYDRATKAQQEKVIQRSEKKDQDKEADQPDKADKPQKATK
ncbi:MAG TPA: hypothetical protein VKA50_00700 [Gammaproteobacteria bacterium]|nr:hypothetical protein [Gammaproteobacteria bacterium]